MTRELVFIHGRAQQRKDSAALKAEWLEALDDGLSKSVLRLPIPTTSVRFPYYGDTLIQFVGGKTPTEAAEVIIRGGPPGTTPEEAIMREMITSVPLIVDAGVGTASDAALAMELGADAVLMNTAIAAAEDSEKMARAMKAGIEAGRLAWESGRMPKKLYASASSPLVGVVGS